MARDLDNITNDELLSHLDEPDLQGMALPFISNSAHDCITYQDKLVSIANHPERLNRTYILELTRALAHCVNYGKIDFLANLLASDRDDVLLLALNVVPFLDVLSLPIVDPIRHLIESLNPDVASAACVAAGKGGYDSAGIGINALIPALISALNRSEDVALSAALALGEYGPDAKGSIDALLRLRNRTSDALVRHRIEMSMEQILGEKNQQGE